MNDLVAFYQKIAEQKRSSSQQIAALQARGVAYLLENGFPTRHDEAWKYSAPTAFLQEEFYPPDTDRLCEPQAKQSSDVKVAGLGQNVHTIHIQNGRVFVAAAECPLPQEVQVMTLAEAFEREPGLLSRYHQQLFPIEHGFHALNAAMLDTTLMMYVPANIRLSLPVAWLYAQDQTNQAVHARCVLILEEGASVNLIEEFLGEKDCVYLSSRVLEVFLESGAELTHTLIQRESQKAYHLSHLFVHQAKDSSMKSHVINLGGKWVRSDQSFYLQGQKATCLLNGVYGLNHAQHMDHHTAVFHESGGCESHQDYKGIVAGASRAIFNGRVVVAPHAQQTRAIQKNKNLLLSQEAEVDTKPQLEIEANDVSCSHGATVGQLSEDALFYFASRGVSREDAIRFMITGFSANNMALLDHPALQAALVSRLNQHILGESHECSA
jgi:Fe-S cluster assembly protein SufD